MKTLTEYENEKRRESMFKEGVGTHGGFPTGVACPSCGNQLLRDANRLLSLPPQVKFFCNKCGFHKNVLA